MAGGAGGKEVGRVSIRVVPNTEGFREKLKADLEAIERGEEVKVRVGTDFDKDGLKAKAKAAAEEAETSVKIRADGDLFQRRMVAELDKIHKATEAKIALTPDGEQFRRAIESEVGALKKDATSRIPLDVELAAGQRAKVAADIEALKKVAEGSAIKLKLDPEFDYRLRQSLKKFEKDIPVPESFFQRLSGRLGLPEAGGAAGGGHGLGGGAVNELFNFGSLPNLIALTSLLPPILAIAAPLIASIPAMASAIAAPAGVLALGKGGILKALMDADLTDQKMTKGGKKTGPQPIDGKYTLGGALKDLKDQVEKAFETGLTPVFKQLGSIIPYVTPMLTVMADSLVTVAKAFGNFVTSPQTISMIGALFSNISSLIAESAPGVVAFANGIGRLAAQVSTHFPGLATWFNELGDKFSGWVEKISKDGTLDSAISGLKPILNSIIDFVGQLMAIGIKFASDPKMMESITSLLTSLTNLLVSNLPGLADLFNNIVQLVGMIPGAKKGQDFIPPGTKTWWADQSQDQTGGPGGKQPFGGTRPGWWQGAENWESQHIDVLPGKVLDDMKGRFQLIISEAQKVPGAVAEALSGIGSKAAAILSSDAGMIGGAAASAFHTIVTAAQSIVGEVVGAVVSIGSQIVATVRGWGSQLASAAAAAFGQFKAGIIAQAEAIKGAVSGVLGGILSLIPHSPAKEGPLAGAGWTSLFAGGEAIGNQFKNGLEQGFQGVVDSTTTLLEQVKGAIANGSFTGAMRDNVKDEIKAIGTEMKALEEQNRAIPKGKDHKGEHEAIEAQIKELAYLRSKLEEVKKEEPKLKGPSAKDQMDPMQLFGQEIQKLPGIGANFATANLNQFETDLGWSGQGAIPSLINQGISWGTSTMSHALGSVFGNQGKSGGEDQGGVHIHVNSVDEAMQARQNSLNKQAMSYTGSGR